MHFGKAIIAQHTSLPIEHQDVNTLYEKLYTDFIEALDAHDNGISVYDPSSIAVAGLEKRFRDGGINLGSIIGDMNTPDPDGPQDEDSLFGKASTFIGEIFMRKLRNASNKWLPARGVVVDAYKSRFNNHSSGKIMILPKAGIPWKEHLFTIEKEEQTSSAAQQIDEVLYVLYPESGNPDSKWRIQCVPVTDTSFESRKALPEPWRGVRDQELDAFLAAEAEKISTEKLPTGAVFVHASGFIGGHATKEGVLGMAVRSLERS